jgi:hypothetical protein
MNPVPSGNVVEVTARPLEERARVSASVSHQTTRTLRAERLRSPNPAEVTECVGRVLLGTGNGAISASARHRMHRVIFSGFDQTVESTSADWIDEQCLFVPTVWTPFLSPFGLGSESLFPEDWLRTPAVGRLVQSSFRIVPVATASPIVAPMKLNNSTVKVSFGSRLWSPVTAIVIVRLKTPGGKARVPLAAL